MPTLLYRRITDKVTGEVTGVVRLTDKANVPFADGNRDYQVYLEDVARFGDGIVGDEMPDE